MNQKAEQLISELKETILSVENIDEKIELLNFIKMELHQVSPFKNEPVDCVVWVRNEIVEANDYNPNAVAPPEMQLLEHSIKEDGYTQPIVSYAREDNVYEVVDGFHRNRVGKESEEVKKRVCSYLPITVINEDRTGRKDRVAATIRHNRARGTHQIKPMSTIVAELYFSGWSNKRIMQELGMEKDEVLRLKQFTGLGMLFKDREFSKAWE